MAVVVQEMVSAESAGVMFTCDPVAANPSGIFITANFGLGESVVSAMADPDTFSFRRKGSTVELVSKAVSFRPSMRSDLNVRLGADMNAQLESGTHSCQLYI